MNSGGGVPMIAEIGGLIFFLLLVGIVWFVTWLNKSRSSGGSNVWQQLAQSLGGTFTQGSGFQGNVLDMRRPYGTVRLEIKLMSAFDCKASPYHGRNGGGKMGGTFTHAHATYVNQNGPTYKGRVVDARSDPLFDNHSALSTLPGHAMIFSTPGEIMLVIEEHIKDGNVLHAAAQLVDDFAKRAASPPAVA